MQYKKCLGSFLVVVILFLVQTSFAVNIDKIIAKNPELTFAILVQDLKTGESIYSYNPKRLLIPASVTKVFTAYAALAYLGDDFNYKTTISFDESLINEGVLAGDLYVKFSGDPSLTRDDFVDLLSKLKNYKIKEVKGKIIVDDSVFGQDYKAIGETWDDAKFCYAAPSSSIVINKNCFFLALFAGKKEGDLSRIVGKSYSKISNKIIMKNNSQCSPELKEFSNNSYDFTGCLNLKADKTPLRIAYQNPRLMVVGLIDEALNNLGIIKNNDVEFGAFNNKFLTKIEHKSVPLSVLVKEMQSKSDNLMANNILKTLGAYYFKGEGNFKTGALALKNIIESKTKINFENIRLVDGAGQSRYNLLSPSDLIKLLQSAYNQKHIWDSFYNSLSIVGVDGLLSDRLKDHKNLRGKISAKSGTLTGVANLVGYINKEDKIFAIMLNGYVGSKASMSKIIDEILVEIEKL